MLALILRVFGFEIHTAALTGLSRVPGKGNKKPEGSASPRAPTAPELATTPDERQAIYTDIRLKAEAIDYAREAP